MKALLSTTLLAAILTTAPLGAEAAYGQINSFSASATTVPEGTQVDFSVDFGVSTTSFTHGGSNPEPEPIEGYQTWATNWYSYERETLTSLWLEAGGQTFFETPSVSPGSSYGGTWNFSVLFPTQGSFTITLNGGWTSSIESYHSNESAYRDCFNNDPGGTNELSCSSWTFYYNDGDDIYSGDGSFSSQSVHVNVVAVPEPQTWALMLAGAAVLITARRKRA